MLIHTLWLLYLIYFDCLFDEGVLDFGAFLLACLLAYCIVLYCIVLYCYFFLGLVRVVGWVGVEACAGGRKEGRKEGLVWSFGGGGMFVGEMDGEIKR